MTLRAVVDTLDDIDASLHGEYTEKDGKFFLDLDDSIRTHTSILPLSNSLANAKKDKKAVQDKLDAANARLQGLPDDFDLDEYTRLVADEKKRKEDPNYKPGNDDHLQRQREQYDQRIATMKTEHAAQLAEKDNIIASLDGEIVGTKAETELSNALAKHGVDPAFQKASRVMLQKSVKVVKDEDTGERRAIVETDLGEVDVDRFVETWTKSDEGKPFVKQGHGSDAKGGGKGGSSETANNPWDAKTRNLTQQGVIIRSDKAKAERLMRAAGLAQANIDKALGR